MRNDLFIANMIQFELFVDFYSKVNYHKANYGLMVVRFYKKIKTIF